jgi:hypothetical protein
MLSVVMNVKLMDGPFIIIIGKRALFEPYPSVEDSARFVNSLELGFHFFGFCNNNFFYRARSSALRSTPNLGDQVSVFMSTSDRMAQL